MSDRVNVLDRAVREIARPVLEAHGFHHDGKRTFRRADPARGTCRIVNVQVGVRAMGGRFTMNLGVYAPAFFVGPGTAPGLEEAEEWHCLPQFRKRLGKLLVSAWTRRWTRILGPSGRAWWTEILYGTPDRWWRFSENESDTALSVRRATEEVRRVGLEWLHARDDPEAMRRDFMEIKARLSPGS